MCIALNAGSYDIELFFGWFRKHELQEAEANSELFFQ
jgi:hypothetical protein